MAHAPSFNVPFLLFADTIDHLFSLGIGGRSNRKEMARYIEERFSSKDVDKYINMIDNLMDVILKINKKTPVVGTNLVSRFDLGNGLEVDCKTHYIYNRKEGPCYGIVLPDTHLSPGEISEEQILTHVMTCGAALVDYEVNKETIRFVEIIAFYNDCKDYDKFLFRIGPHQQSYLDYARESLLKLTRRFHLEEKSHANWSNKCLWCPQASSCDGIRSWREYSRQLVQRTRHRDD